MKRTTRTSTTTVDVVSEKNKVQKPVSGNVEELSPPDSGEMTPLPANPKIKFKDLPVGKTVPPPAPTALKPKAPAATQQQPTSLAAEQPPATSTPNQLTPKVPPVRPARKTTSKSVPASAPPSTQTVVQPSPINRSKWTSFIIGLIAAVLVFLAFVFALLWMSNIDRHHVGYSPASVATIVPVTTTNAPTPDEATRKAVMAEVDRANQAVAEKGELQRQLSIAQYAQERAESNATFLAMVALTNVTRAVMINGNVGNGNIITVGSTVTVHQVQPPVHRRAPPKPVTYVPPQEQPQVQSVSAPIYEPPPPPVVYAQPPPQIMYSGGAPYGYYSSRPGISFEFGIGIGRRQWAGPPPIGNRYGYCLPGGGQYGYGRHR